MEREAPKCHNCGEEGHLKKACPKDVSIKTDEVPASRFEDLVPMSLRELPAGAWPIGTGEAVQRLKLMTCIAHGSIIAGKKIERRIAELAEEKGKPFTLYSHVTMQKTEHVVAGGNVQMRGKLEMEIKHLNKESSEARTLIPTRLDELLQIVGTAVHTAKFRAMLAQECGSDSLASKTYASMTRKPRAKAGAQQADESAGEDDGRPDTPRHISNKAAAAERQRSVMQWFELLDQAVTSAVDSNLEKMTKENAAKDAKKQVIVSGGDPAINKSIRELLERFGKLPVQQRAAALQQLTGIAQPGAVV